MTADGTELIAGMAGLGAAGRLRLSSRPAVPGALPEVASLLAGVAQVDLTPPPGLPKAGYSRNASTGTGFRTRLRATVLHLRRGGTSVAVIATDLLGGSALVQHLVAAEVAGATDVPLSGLFLSATHTHGAPGQFHGTDFYNRFSSNRPGVDPDWTALVARRITAAVIEAVSTRRPSALAWGRTEVPGVTRNRSLPAYRRNPGAAAAEAETAVNPALNLLRVDALAPDGGTSPMAAFTFFSVHGTAVPMTSRTYNADLWAYVYAQLGEELAGSHGRVTVAAVQGTHGDATPALQGPAGHSEAARIGRRIGAAAAGVYRQLDAAIAVPAARTPDLGAGLREVDLGAGAGWGGAEGGAGRGAGRGGAVAGGVRLPRRPAVGAALLAGARENETPMICRIPPFRAGSGKRRLSGSEQGAKWVLGSRWLQPLVLPLEGFPRVLPVHLLRVGEVLLTGLPMEITLETGRRIAAAAEAAWRAGGPDGNVRSVVCSVVDEYAGYCTTEQEYAAQFYEGGHTLYGPSTQRFLAAVVTDLAGRLAGGHDLHEALPVRSFDLAIRRYLPAPAGAGAAGRTDPRRSLAAPCWGTADAQPCLEWTWCDAAPGDLRWDVPMVSLVRPDGSVVTDQHGDLEVEYLRGRGGRGGRGGLGGSRSSRAPDHRYVVRWFPQAQEARGRGSGYHFIRLAGGNDQAPAEPLHSPVT